ncbi:MAG TPA: type II toxin-antitoxin system prevent-host-death family antitoxin [Terriglobales bacterium]|nr:type II toxin-antitoxin system prevent-host-death family antitoxin [Terriglobales bacterium]
METVGVRQLKDRLSEQLRRVKLGAEIVVTEHGKPVARLSPVRPAPEWALAMASRGELILGSGNKPTGATVRLRGNGVSAADTVLKMRERV